MWESVFRVERERVRESECLYCSERKRERESVWKRKRKRKREREREAIWKIWTNRDFSSWLQINLCFVLQPSSHSSHKVISQKNGVSFMLTSRYNKICNCYNYFFWLQVTTKKSNNSAAESGNLKKVISLQRSWETLKPVEDKNIESEQMRSCRCLIDWSL